MPDNCQPGTVRNYIKAALAGMVAGLCLALILNRFIWLEMRLTTGHAIPLLTAVFATAFGAARRQIRLVVFLLLEPLAAAILFAGYTPATQALLIVPAALFRDGFHLGFLSLWQIDMILLCLLGTANLVWIPGAAVARWGGTSKIS